MKNCPEHQIISIYLDGELPSPWKEKMETHLNQCSVCSEKFESYKMLKGQFNDDELETSMKRVWDRLEAKRIRIRSYSLWQRRLSIPLPAAAAVVLIVLTALWVFGNQNRSQNNPADIYERANIILAAEEEMPSIIPVANLNDVLQFLGTDGSEILIMRLPESRNFFRAGEPAVVRAADYSRRSP